MRRINSKLALAICLIAIVGVAVGFGTAALVNPVVTITSPVNASTVPDGTIHLTGSVYASGNVRAIAIVTGSTGYTASAELTLVAQGDHYVFDQTINNCPAGSYTVVVKVLSVSGGQAVFIGGASVSVGVSGAVGPCPPATPECPQPPVQPPPPPVVYTTPKPPTPPAPIVFVKEPPPPQSPDLIINVPPADNAPAPIVVFEQPKPQNPQHVTINMPPPQQPSKPEVVTAPQTPNAPPPQFQINHLPPPPPVTTTDCDCVNTSPIIDP